MKKKIGITLSFLSLIIGFYLLITMLYNVHTYSSVSLSTFDYIVLCSIIVSILICGFLVIYTYKNHHIGRFNADIFVTICLFFMFMLAFAVPSNIITHLGSLSSTTGLWFFEKTMCHFAANGVGIYEGFFFASMIFMGFTIDESAKHQND